MGSDRVLLQASQSVERFGDRLRSVEVVAEGRRRVEHRLHQRKARQRQTALTRGVGDQAQVLADELDEKSGAPVVRDYLGPEVGELPRTGRARQFDSRPASRGQT